MAELLLSVSNLLIALVVAICWQADAVQPHDVLINGMKRGVSPKHRHNPKFRYVIIAYLSVYHRNVFLAFGREQTSSLEDIHL